jgi:adenylate kinase
LKAKAFMDKGELVPDSVVMGIVADRLKAEDCRKGFVLDGFPRNLAQAQDLDETLSHAGDGIEHVLYLQTSREVILRRLTGRRVCKDCNAGYNVFTLPPKKEGVCDACGGQLIQRQDDKEGTILNRLAVYENQTKDLIAYYRDQGVLQTADGDLERQEALRQIVGILKA